MTVTLEDCWEWWNVMAKAHTWAIEDWEETEKRTGRKLSMEEENQKLHLNTSKMIDDFNKREMLGDRVEKEQGCVVS